MPHVTREDEARIWWEATGPDDGEPVLLIMGLAYPAAMWWRALPALTDRYRVIVLDNRGAGHTGDVPGAPYAIETMAADCAAVLDAAGVESAHIVGYSMGGLIAQELALTQPERVRSLCLIATHPGICHGVVSDEAWALLTGRTAMTPEEMLEASVPFNYATTTPRARMEEDWAVRLPLAATLRGYRAQWLGHQQWTSLERLPNLAVPTLVVSGDADTLVLPRNSDTLASTIPGAELQMVPGANHLLFTDQTETAHGVLREWLERNSSAS